MSDNIARILALAAIGAGGGGGGALTPIVVDVLPSVGEEGKLYLVPRQVTETHNVFDEYIYTNGDWEKIGTADIDLSNYYTKSEVNALIPDDLADLRSDSTHRLVTDIEKSTWGAKYDKPSGGIPKTDLTSTVQTSLGKADSALQSFTESDPVFGASAAAGITSSDITSWNNKQEVLVSGNNIKTINNNTILGSGNLSIKRDQLTVEANWKNSAWTIDAEDVDTILQKLENHDEFDLFVCFMAGDSDNYTGLGHIDRHVTSGNDYIELIVETTDTAGTSNAIFYGELCNNADCHFFQKRYEFLEEKVNVISNTTSGYVSPKAVYDFGNNYLSKTNAVPYTPTENYHPATKKYVDDNSGSTDLSNYLAKNNTISFTPSGNYNPATKKYVDDTVSTAISNLDITDREIVQQLPTQNISTKTIYMVPKTTPGSQNAYTEYMYINNAWEKIGDTEIDLSDYATKDYVDEKVPAFFDGSKSEWDTLTQEQQKNILFAAVNDFELNSEEEATLLGVLGDKTGIDTDTELEETLNAFLNIAGENE